MTDFPALWLKKGEEARLRAGHYWVFSNEIDVAKSPLSQFEAGQLVTVTSSAGKPLGVAYVNPRTLIAARLLTRNAEFNAPKFIRERLQQALNYRDQFSEKPFYRWCYGESDGLPGLIVDRYGDAVVAQLNTAGMAAMSDLVVDAIESLIQPASIVLRNDSIAREMEGLEREEPVAKGDVPEYWTIEENGASFRVPALSGQKTGWFYDHRDSRAYLASLCAGKRVLDVFSYLGAWGLTAGVHGASEVHCVESSASACDWISQNAELNQIQDKVEVFQGDAMEVLQALRDGNEKYDVVILDPPAFIKRKKDIKNGLVGYQRINQAALQLIKYDGLLFSASCSYHLQESMLVDVMNKAARHLDRQLQMFYFGSQSWDHPVVPVIPETRYIKTIGARVIKPC